MLHPWVSAARRHRAFALVLLIAVLIRVMAMIGYPPALFFSDSWGYLYAAYTHRPIAVSYQRPYGYPLLILLFSFPGRDLVELVGVQHIAGLATGALVYLALLRAGVNAGLSAVLSAVVLLDGYRIALEQYVMPEAFFMLTLLASLLVLSWPYLARRVPARVRTQVPLGWRGAAWAGLLLAAASFQRQAAVFMVPVVIIYLIWCRVRWRSMLAFLLALLIPILAYAGINDAKLGFFNYTANGGWTLYGRVASFAHCSADGIPERERALCPTQADHFPAQPTFYIWNRLSPAVKMFPQGQDTVAAQKRTNAILGRFARQVIEHQPLDYIGVSLGDFARYFTPGATPFADSVSATSLPRTGAEESIDEQRRRELIPQVHPQVRWPASIVAFYRSIVHLPRAVLAVLAVLSAVALTLRTPARREIWLFTGSGLLMLLVTAATAGFGLRYLLPVVPMILIGGGLALADLAGRRPGLMPWRRRASAGVRASPPERQVPHGSTG